MENASWAERMYILLAPALILVTQYSSLFFSPFFLLPGMKQVFNGLFIINLFVKVTPLTAQELAVKAKTDSATVGRFWCIYLPVLSTTFFFTRLPLTQGRSWQDLRWY